MVAAKSESIRRWHWDAIKALIAQRTPEQVAKMEAERGLS